MNETPCPDELLEAVTACAREVEAALGPGLSRESYLECLAHELSLTRISFARDVEVTLLYKGLRLPETLSIDLVAENRLGVAVRTASQSPLSNEQRFRTLLRHGKLEQGVLLDFRGSSELVSIVTV